MRGLFIPLRVAALRTALRKRNVFGYHRFVSSSSSSSSPNHHGTSSRNNYYTVLGIPETATTKEIKQAFRKMAKLHHPDIHNVSSGTPGTSSPLTTRDPDQFIAIVLAYEQLSNPVLRTTYNNQLRLLRQQETLRKSRRTNHSSYSTGYYPFDQSFASTTHTTNSTTQQQHSSTSSPKDDVTYDDTSNDNPNHIFGGYNGIARRAQKYGENSVWNALLEANTGPIFQGNLNDFPYAFE